MMWDRGVDRKVINLRKKLTYYSHARLHWRFWTWLKHLIAPLSTREKVIYGLLALVALAVVITPKAAARTDDPGKLFSVAPDICSGDQNWINPHFAIGQPSIDLEQTVESIKPDIAAQTSEGIGSLTCFGFKRNQEHNPTASYLHVALYVESEDAAKLTVAQDPTLSEPSTDPVEINERPGAQKPNAFGDNAQNLTLDTLLAIEISADNGKSWLPYHNVKYGEILQGQQLLTLELDEAFTKNATQLAVRITPGSQQHNTTILVDGFAWSYEVGAAMEVTTTLINDANQPTTGAQPIVSSDSEIAANIIIKNPTDHVFETITRKLLSDDVIDNTAITTKAVLTDDEGTEIATADGDIEWLDSNQKISTHGIAHFDIIPPSMEPGGYSLKITTEDPLGASKTTTQDFLWGVLALNSDKTVYKVNDDANFAMTVLDEYGATVCDAKLSLDITKPDDSVVNLSTDNNLITKSNLCEEYGPHIDPDYAARQLLEQAGNYVLTLHAETSNGTYSITDIIRVEEAPKASLRRTGPTRIYPIETYTMALELNTSEPFSGTVREVVPKEFKVKQIEGAPQFSQEDTGDQTILEWYVDTNAEKTVTLTYEFDAPDIAPEFYLLGPAELTNNDDETYFTEARQWQIASDALEVTIDATIIDATDEYAPSPSVVFTDAQTGYAFYIDATSQDLAYSKTTNGGANWGAAVVIDTARTWNGVAIWYDQWTPGDETGRLVHIAAVESSTDDTHYTYLDTSTDTLRGSMVIAQTATAFTQAADGPPTITKGASGYLFIASNFTTPAGGIVSKSINAGANWTVNTPAGWSAAAIDQVQLVPLLTNDDVLAIRANTAGNTIESRVYSEATDTWAGAWTSITALTENTTYDQWFSASIRKSTGDVYLSFSNNPAAATNDMEFRIFSDTARTWSTGGQLFTDNATVIAPSVVVDDTDGSITVAYVRGTLNATTSVYYKRSTDGGTTWSAESARLNGVIDDIKNVRSGFTADQRIFFVWYNDDLDDIMGNSVAPEASYNEVTIDATLLDATDEFGPSPSVAFVDKQTGYAFYVDATSQDLAYSKSSDGGTTWSAPVLIETTRTWTALSVWFDQWTPGDTTGTLIHVAAVEDTTDDTYYTYLDTSTDTLRTAPVLVHSQTAFTESADGPPTITKNGQDFLFVETNFTTTAGGVVSKSINAGANWTAITPAGWSTVAIDQMQLIPLLTNDDVMAIRVNTAGNNIQSRIYSEATDTWAGAWTTIAALTENTTYDQWFSAASLKSTGDVYLSFVNNPTNATADMEFWTFDDGTRTWTARTQIFTNNATVISPAVTLDESTGDVYVSYVRGTLNATTNVYFVSSTNDGVTWSVESQQVNEITDDIKYIRGNYSSEQRLFIAWYNDDLDDMLGSTIATFNAAAELSSYRVFQNTNGTSIGSAIAAQNTATQIPDSNQAFRLRLLLTNVGRTIEQSDESYRLQFAAKGGGTCAAPTGSNPSVYTNVTSTTIIAFYNNSTPSDGAALTTSANDPTDSPNTVVAQSYEEANHFTNAQSAIAVGQAGMWDFSLVDNSSPSSTTYCFRVVRTDGSLIETYTNYPEITTSPNVAPNSPTSLAQRRINDTAIATGGWTNESSIELTASATDTNNPDSLALCVEVDQIGTAFSNTNDSCSSLNAYSGSPITIVHTVSGLTHNTSYHWQARLRDEDGLYSAWVSYGGNPEANRDYGSDTANPIGTVYDGTSVGVDIDYNNGSLTTLSGNWSMADALSGISGYEYSVGTTAGGTNVLGWTSNGTGTSVTANTLTLQTSQAYYFNVRTTDNAGNQVVHSADGIYVAPTLSFNVSAGSVDFGALNVGNGFNATANTTLTTSTNAHAGYVVRAYALNFLNNGSSVIPMFNGGTYAAPDGWQSGDKGYGYTSSDTSVQGSNLFNPATCAGGNASPCYAPFSITQPGDIVADNTSTVSGTPIVNEQFIISHKVTTDSVQSAGRYTTTLIYSVVARY